MQKMTSLFGIPLFTYIFANIFSKIMMTEYAIVDIETTGGYAKKSQITEIAIIIHDGQRILKRWTSLINPLQHIPNTIFALTGIDDEMVMDAPLFSDVAQHIFTLLNGRIFVAHHVNFDYSFIHHQLLESGFEWNARKLCTVRWARKMLPGLRSYSLGHLCDEIGIPINNRHRAGGDADATVILFEKLLAIDQEVVHQQMVKRNSMDQRLPPNLPPEEFNALPHTPGVYYFHDRKGEVIYVGKAKNIQKRVTSHFTGTDVNRQRQHFLKEIYHVTFERCGTELLALLVECQEIKRLWPKFNRALKRFEPKYGLFKYEGMDGYTYLAVGKLNNHVFTCIQTFNTEYEGFQTLRSLMTDHELDHRFCKFSSTPATSAYSAYIDDTKPNATFYNEKVTLAIEKWIANQPSFLFYGHGRDENEKSVILVEKGTLYGFGYIDQSEQIDYLPALRERLKPSVSNHYMMQLIHNYARKYPENILKIDAVDVSLDKKY